MYIFVIFLHFFHHPDVLFQVEDGTVAAHKCLLMARCDVMFGMFSYNFKESSLKLVTHHIKLHQPTTSQNITILYD